MVQFCTITENSYGWCGKSTRAATIFAYPSRNETVGDEKREQKGGKVLRPPTQERRSLRGDGGQMPLCGLTERSAL